MESSQQVIIPRIILGKSISGSDVALDIQEIVTGRTLLCCITGWGKSWTARRIIEQLNGIAGVVIIDVEGEYYTLLEKFPQMWHIGNNGIGGSRLTPETAGLLAEQVLKKRISAIIDLSGPLLDRGTGQAYVAEFVDEFLALEKSARKPYLFVLEEADELVAERGITKSECRDEIIRMVKKGRKRGMGTMVLTQRPAWVSKFVISQCANKIIGRTEWPRDLETLRDFAQIPPALADPLSRSPYSLKNMERGCFYVSGEFVEREDIVRVGPVQTKHLGDTPQVFSGAPTER